MGLDGTGGSDCGGDSLESCGLGRGLVGTGGHAYECGGGRSGAGSVASGGDGLSLGCGACFGGGVLAFAGHVHAGARVGEEARGLVK